MRSTQPMSLSADFSKGKLVQFKKKKKKIKISVSDREQQFSQEFSKPLLSEDLPPFSAQLLPSIFFLGILLYPVFSS